jgi:hypothetical protein
MTDTLPGETSSVPVGYALESVASGPAAHVAYLGPVERLIGRVAAEVRMLAALTPTNAQVERARMADELRAGQTPIPRWSYAPRQHDRLVSALEAADGALDRLAEAPLARLYQARVRELTLELALCEAAGTADIGRLARERFAADGPTASRASELAALWLETEPLTSPADAALESDSPDPRSLVSRMRAAVGEARLPFRVLVQPALAPLAATGDGVILVAGGRLIHAEDIERTVLHEVDGHARPRARSLSSPLSLVRFGTARGIDDQEGRALVLEDRAGLLGPRRKRQLAVRHRAVEAMLCGASFGDVANILKHAHGLVDAECIVVAERAFRGSDGTRPGIGRERVYLEAYVRVRDRLAACPDDERILELGQIAVDAIDAVRASLDDLDQLT